VDLGAVKAAPVPVLIRGTIATARNAQDLLQDAQVLAEAGRMARAYSLAALAVEEAGKVVSLSLLTVMPEALRAQAPVGRMLEWHQFKQAEGLLIGRLSDHVPGLAPKLEVMSADELAQVVSALNAPADEADRLKRHGFYVDVVRGATIREPSQITESMVISQLDRARQAVSAAGELLEPETQACIVNPPTEEVELSQAKASALTGARYARTPEDAVDVILNAVSMFRDRILTQDAESAPVPGELRPRMRRQVRLPGQRTPPGAGVR
jgi:AbiV family abortive infection protein